jgi:hypothetical protein
MDEQLHVSPNVLKTLDLTGCHPGDWREITLSTLYLTGIANHTLNGSFRFEALEEGLLIHLFSVLFARPAEGKGWITMEIKNGYKEWIQSLERDETRQDHLLAFHDFCLDLLEEEFGKFPAGESMDPRFVKGLLICKS